MLVDWFTVAAQALNFLILVWLMKRFLYKPILQALEVREKRIATELADATAMKADATNVRDELQHRNDEFDHQRADLVKRATDEANADGQRLRDEACRIAAALRTARADGLRTDAQNLNQAIGRRTEQEVFSIARKALTDLASVSLEERVTDVFIRRVRAMDGTAKDRLAGALKAGPDPTIIRSAFELPPAQRAAVQQLLDETFSGDVHLRFETAPELVSGIELTTNGQQVGWSIADYLSTLEQEVGALLETQGTFGPASADPPGPEPALHAA
jgi:F-type H+-transporting ATPase subunit b